MSEQEEVQEQEYPYKFTNGKRYPMKSDSSIVKDYVPAWVGMELCDKVALLEAQSTKQQKEIDRLSSMLAERLKRNFVLVLFILSFSTWSALMISYMQR